MQHKNGTETEGSPLSATVRVWLVGQFTLSTLTNFMLECCFKNLS